MMKINQLQRKNVNLIYFVIAYWKFWSKTLKDHELIKLAITPMQPNWNPLQLTRIKSKSIWLFSMKIKR